MPIEHDGVNPNLYFSLFFFNGIKRIFKSAAESYCQKAQLFKHLYEGFSVL